MYSVWYVYTDNYSQQPQRFPLLKPNKKTKPQFFVSLMRRFLFSFSFFKATLFSPRISEFHNLNITRTSTKNRLFSSIYWAYNHTHSPVMAPTSSATTAVKNILNRRKHKIVVIMGPTGSGKSKLSIDLATLYFPSSEIINSDKMQVYYGLDNTTNKISEIDRKGVPHHLFGEFQPTESTPEFTPLLFRTKGAEVISQIISRRKIPFIVGGSNSFIYSLLAKRFDPELDVFNESESSDSVCKQLRYDCCFIWVDVDLGVLNEYLDIRVDEMLDSGMFEELAEFFASELSDPDIHSGIKKAIGVPEFENYFRHYYKKKKSGGGDVAEYEKSVRLIKENTRVLAKRQLGKIQRLRDAGWDLHKIDATQAFREAIELRKKKKKKKEVEQNESDGGESVAESEASCVWEKRVLEPSVKVVKQFLME